LGAEGVSNATPSSALLQSSKIPQLPSSSIGAASQAAPAVVSNATQSAPASGKPADSVIAPHNGFRVFDLTPPAAAGEGKLGPRRDGRVRNPVPRKLKGKTDMRNGNFAVMHMDMSGSSAEQVPRGEAAQRTSENTAKAARSALQDSYKPIKRRRVEEAEWQPAPAEATVPQLQIQPPVVPGVSQTEVVHRTESMSAEETKYEQARLLTLLRSISPLTVVDQICKALAFFGGIPGAPAPEDGVFPDSADANGSGALFVGWLSEIFPELERKGWRPSVPKGREATRGKRPRGRPKGSKATKVRKDKGIKKGPKDPSREESRGLSAPYLRRLQPASTREENDEGEDDDWVDVAEAEPIMHDKDSGKIPARASQIASINSVPSGAETIGLETDELDGFEQQNPPTTANMGKRRPGRPRGSRNRPKEKDADGNEIPAVEVFALNQMTIQPSSSPGNNTHLENSQTPLSQLKRKPGRPSGSRTKSKESGVAENHINASPSNANGSVFNRAPAPANRGRTDQPQAGESSTSTMPQGLSAEERAVLEAFRKSKAITVPGEQPSAVKPPEKRKRAPRKANNAAGEESIAILPAVLPTSEAISTPVMGAQQSDFSKTDPTPPPRSTSAIPPPPKRQRKPKGSAVALAQTITPQETSVPKSTPTPTPVPTPPARPIPASNAQRPIPVPSMVFSSAPMASEQIIAPARPPAQGLEAHYERFANLQQQQQQHDTIQPRQDQHSVAQSSPLQSSAFYQQPRQMPSPYAQYQTQQSSRPYHASANPQMDPYRTTNTNHQQQQQQQQQHNTFSPRQQQQQTAQQSFAHFTDSSFIDLPALESVSNGTANVGAYGQHGQGVGRSSSQGGFGAGSTGMGNGFEATMSDNDLRERLLRGIGRR